MGKEIRIKHECGSCGGTGLYVGMAERDGAAVVCGRCKGKGWQESVFQEFTGRKERKGVLRVFEANVGIVIGEGDGIKLSDFGGMPLADWISGKRFESGTENRAYACPRQWTQCAGGPMPAWDKCYSCLGRTFKNCAHFDDKATCWAQWDHERANAE